MKSELAVIGIIIFVFAIIFATIYDSGYRSGTMDENLRRTQILIDEGIYASCEDLLRGKK